LQISNRLTSQIQGLDQAIRNANDGISLAQTAEGAMNVAGGGIPGVDDLAGPALAGLVLGKGHRQLPHAMGSAIWDKLAAESPYDVPLKSYTPLYEGFTEML
jgi:flagellin